MACPDPNLIAELAAGAVPEEDKSRVEAHLETCADCRRLVEELRRPPELEPGAQVGRYLVLSKVGAGAMGAVYAAQDPKLDRKVALKLLHASGDQQRLVAEGRAMARLAHPNVVPVLDLDTTSDGRVFAAMEFVDGVTLRQWLAQAPRSLAEVVQVLLEAGRGLAAAHAVGLTHRDFKPENLLIGADGRTRVTDFGLARSGTLGGATSPAKNAALPEGLATASTTPQAITGTGEIVGTPAYMSPEQFRAEVATARSDQFSFSVVLWEALYGSRPFDDGSASVKSLAEAVLAGNLREPPSGRGVPARLRRIIMRGLDRDPERRYPSLEALLGELERVTQTQRRAGAAVALGAAALLLAGALGIFYQGQGRLCREPPLASIWNPARKATLATAFQKSGVWFAASAWPPVERALDEWARGFSRMSRDSCEATEVRHDQSRDLWLLRHQCLEERKAGFTALVEALEKPTAAVVERAAQAAGGLGAVADCGDLKRLVGPLAPRPDVAEEAEELRGRYAAAKVRASVGLGSEVRAQLTPIAERAHAIGDRVLEGQALVLRSQQEHKGGAVDASLASAKAAVIAAEEGRDDLTRALAWLRQVELEAERAPAEAAQALEQAHAVLTRLEDDELGAMYEAHAATLDYYAGKAQLAHEHDLRAIALMEKKYGKDDVHVANYISQSSTALIVLGEYDAADAQLERARRLIEVGRGKQHPSYSVTQGTQAFCALARGRADLAIPLAQGAVEGLERSRGAKHLELLDPLDALSRSLREVGRLREAGAAAARVLEIGELAGPDSPEAFLGVVLRAAVLRDSRAFDEAERAYQRVVGAGKAESHVYLTDALHGLAQIAVERGQIRRARQRCEEMRRALDASEEAGQMNNQMCFAEVEEAEGSFAGALARVRSVISDGEKRHRSAMPWGFGAELVWAGRLLVRLDRQAEALPLLERALAAEPAPPAGVVEPMVEARVLLARAIARDDPPRATALAREALALAEKLEVPDSAKGTEARRFVASIVK